MLHNEHRKKHIHILTLDHVLAKNLSLRLRQCNLAANARIVIPNNGKPGIKPEDVEKLAKETLNSRLLIIDVRSYTLIRLQQAYNTIIGYNRADFNRYCHTVLIGDGPVNGSQHTKGLQVFERQLAKLRIDYSASVFFYDPLMEYCSEVKMNAAQGRQVNLPEAIPRFLSDSFKGEVLTVEKIREFLTPDRSDTPEKKQKKQLRLRALRSLYLKKISELYKASPKDVAKCLSKEGFPLPGEMLRINVFPFYFENWINSLLNMSSEAIYSKRKSLAG
ncbi:MAG: hypothetical protein JW912_08305 [Sedimentisphaerales bacterium]|nr:hypothetical protein [Sedimentisphaerales bacterium]